MRQASFISDGNGIVLISDFRADEVSGFGGHIGEGSSHVDLTGVQQHGDGLVSGDSFAGGYVENPVRSVTMVGSVGAGGLGLSSGHTSLLFISNTPSTVRRNGTKSTFIDSLTDIIMRNQNQKTDLISISIVINRGLSGVSGGSGAGGDRGSSSQSSGGRAGGLGGSFEGGGGRAFGDF